MAQSKINMFSKAVDIEMIDVNFSAIKVKIPYTGAIPDSTAQATVATVHTPPVDLFNGAKNVKMKNVQFTVTEVEFAALPIGIPVGEAHNDKMGSPCSSDISSCLAASADALTNERLTSA